MKSSSVALLAVLAVAASARAHGEPAAAHSIVAVDADGVAMVRLTEGLAVRAGDGFRYVCPAAWGEDFIAAALSIPDGPAVVGATKGLFVVGARGAVSPHPDPAAAGSIAALAASGGALFALQNGDGGQRVVQVDAERVRELWQSDQRWSDLAASSGAIHVVRLDGNTVRVAHLSTDGKLLAEEVAAPDDMISAARLVVAGDTVYVVGVLPSLDYVLGRIEDSAWRTVQSARLIAGPIELASGERYVALDGRLSRFDDEQAEPLAAPDFITCLRTHANTSYACANGGLTAIGADGIDGPLFELGHVAPPDLELVPREQRELCMLQWQRYVIDLLAVGIEVSQSSESSDAGANDGGRGDGDADEPPRPAGCTMVGGTASDGVALIALVLASARARRRMPFRREGAHLRGSPY